ncbi:glycosyltransferase family 2 protein [Niveispirillum sp. KHB5.9]|uniref:glycosyltransferase family 2 protein n=1 Tax=Niveispirillum sp. KHB5.9 TaxID=3400269 RepID=UPI003A881759
MGKRYCVVTPYFQEERPVIERCLRSVQAQTVPVDHLMVADGHPQAWLDGEPVRHLKLDRSHGDYGNMARGIGALLAAGEKYDAIAFLDADNWYDADHIEQCLAAADAAPVRPEIVAAQRRLVRADGSLLRVRPPDLPHFDRMDTNCYLFLPPSYHLLAKWCTIPRELAQHGDDLFYFFCKAEKASFAVTDLRTVNYTYMFESVYREIGEEPPPGAKPPVSWDQTQEWLATLTPEEIVLARRGTGLHLRDD